jgi:hypothetical protein
MSKILSDKLMRISGHKENSSTAWMIKVEKLPGTIVHPLQKQNGWVQKYLYTSLFKNRIRTIDLMDSGNITKLQQSLFYNFPS